MTWSLMMRSSKRPRLLLKHKQWRRTRNHTPSPVVMTISNRSPPPPQPMPAIWSKILVNKIQSKIALVAIPMAQTPRTKKSTPWWIRMRSPLRPRPFPETPCAAPRWRLSLRAARRTPSETKRTFNAWLSSLRISRCQMGRSLSKILKICPNASSAMARWSTKKGYHARNATGQERLIISFSKIYRKFWATKWASAALLSTKNFWSSTWRRRRPTNLPLFIQRLSVTDAKLNQ